GGGSGGRDFCGHGPAVRPEHGRLLSLEGSAVAIAAMGTLSRGRIGTPSRGCRAVTRWQRRPCNGLAFMEKNHRQDPLSARERPMRMLTFTSALLLASVSGLTAGGADLTKIDRTIAKEPVYQSKPKYGLLVFGPHARTRVWLVLDGDVLYADRNGNGDLT